MKINLMALQGAEAAELQSIKTEQLVQVFKTLQTRTALFLLQQRRIVPNTTQQ